MEECAGICLPIACFPGPLWEKSADVPKSPTGKMPEGSEGAAEIVSPMGLLMCWHNSQPRQLLC